MSTSHGLTLIIAGTLSGDHGPGMRWCPGDYVWPGWWLRVGTRVSATCTTPPSTTTTIPSGLPRDQVPLRFPFRRQPAVPTHFIRVSVIATADLCERET